MVHSSPYHTPTDASTKRMREFIHAMGYATLATLDENGLPHLARVGMIHLTNIGIVALMSNLSTHGQYIQRNPNVSFFIAQDDIDHDTVLKGDPLTHERVQFSASALPYDKKICKAPFLQKRPKTTVYYDFEDFFMMRFELKSALLNQGFGKATLFDKSDLSPWD